MFKNLSIRKKLVISFGIILLLFVASVFIAASTVSNVASSLESFVTEPHALSNAVWGMKDQMMNTQRDMYRALTDTTASGTQAAVNDANAAADRTYAYLSSAQTALEGSTDGMALLNKLQTSLTAASEPRKRVIEYAGKMENDKALKVMQEEYLPQIETARSVLNEMGDYVASEADRYNQKGQTIERLSVIILFSLAIMSLVLSLILCTAITRSITKPLSELMVAADHLSEGNLKVEIAYHSKDEIGQVSASMRHTITALDTYITAISAAMKQLSSGDFIIKSNTEYKGDFINLRDSILEFVASMSNTLTQINQSADQVSFGANQVSSGAQALSQGATEQASSVEELSATITEISGQVKKNAENAVGASHMVGHVAEKIEQSNQQMQQLTSAMDDINNASREIGKIIKTIEDIAFQTNILALNAAVEAARAGAAGKGFAVVADEVRNLASKSAEAAKNTTSLIEGSIKAVENGTNIANETAKSLLAVVDGAREVSHSVDEISNASSEQAGSIAQVTMGVDQISSVVQTNSATSEESAAASEELSGQAQMLKELVSRFRLHEGNTPVAATETPRQPAIATAEYHSASTKFAGTTKY